jgi:disulfide bond formation protein DsbB
MQRQPYYYGIPTGHHRRSSLQRNRPAELDRPHLSSGRCLLMVVGAGIGVYHAGVEWHFWAGPTACSTSAGSMTQDAGNLLTELNTIKGPSCTEAALRVLGLSMAGWNVIASLILAAFAFIGVRKSS